MSQHESLLKSLLRYDRSLEDILEELEELDEGEGEEIEFSLDDAVVVLTRFVEGELTTENLEEWAETVRQREDVVFDGDHEESLEELLDDVGDLTRKTAERWIARLEGEIEEGDDDLDEDEDEDDDDEDGDEEDGDEYEDDDDADGDDDDY